MTTTRRSIVPRLIAAAAATLAALRASAVPARAAPADAVPRVVYHLSDMAKVHFVLGNMINHVQGMGGPDKVSLTLVVHGPALDAFTTKHGDGTLESRLRALAGSGSTLVACGNTMKGAQLSLADLVPGFVVADEGGVVRLAKLQAEGYAYLRP